MKLFNHIFSSGLRLVYRQIDNDRPATIFFAVDTGSVNEEENNNGISHFIEHLTFKGTKKRTAKDITRNFEEIGARANAYTSLDRTCFYASGLNEKFEECLEILSDIFFSSTYNEEEIEKERRVIFEEIDMYDDNPESVASDKFYEAFYAGSSASRPVLGTKESLKGINRQKILEYIKYRYVPNNIVLSVVAGLSFNKVKKLVEKYVESHFKGIKLEVEEKNKSLAVVPDKKFISVKKDIAQTQVVFGFPADNIYTKDYMTYQLLSFIFGGGMGSRLFSKIRDDEGLVYTISCLPEMFEWGGHLLIYFGSNDKNAKKAVDLIKQEIVNLLEEGVKIEELERAKVFCKSLIVSSNEKGESLARVAAQNIILFNKVLSIEERLEEIDKVTIDDLMRVASKVFNFSNVCGSIVSKSVGEEVFESLQ